jgi:hypothetical protein
MNQRPGGSTGGWAWWRNAGIVAFVVAASAGANATEPTAVPQGLYPDRASSVPANAIAPRPSVALRDPVVATDQSNVPAHRETTREIRQALVRDDSLSLGAKSILVVTTADGVVTVQGTVDSEQERAVIVSTAQRLAPSTVVDRIEVEGP